MPLDKILSRPVSELSGDDRNIAVLARAYHGMSGYAVWENGRFVEPANPPPFTLSLQGRGRGMQDTATISHDGKEASILINSPYGKGRGQIFATGKSWPTSLVIRLQKKPGETAASTVFRMANQEYGFTAPLDGPGKAFCGQVMKGLDLDRPFGEDFLSGNRDQVDVGVKKTDAFIEIVVPVEMSKGNPASLAFEWN